MNKIYESYRALNKENPPPAIGVYTGTGASHSWLWFVDIFNRMGFYDLYFLDEHSVRENKLNGINTLAVSGGDTFAIAKGLGEKGAEVIKNFINRGGRYIGSCAGAYLPLNSSKDHLNMFNFANVKIANLVKILPEARQMKEKFYTAYGCSYIFHPVREEISLKTTGVAPFGSGVRLLAPLYGGPALIAWDTTSILAKYEKFTNKTLFLTDPQIAHDTVIGKAAAVRTSMGKGHLFLFGPHFEHPDFPQANALLAEAIYWENNYVIRNKKQYTNSNVVIKGDKAKNFLFDIRRELSNSRIIAYSMEMLPFYWLIGNKVYEPSKILVFIEAMWSRLKELERSDLLYLLTDSEEHILCAAKNVTSALRNIKLFMTDKMDSTEPARELFLYLNIMASRFMEIYFNTIKFFDHP